MCTVIRCGLAVALVPEAMVWVVSSQPHGVGPGDKPGEGVSQRWKRRSVFFSAATLLGTEGVLGPHLAELRADSWLCT